MTGTVLRLRLVNSADSRPPVWNTARRLAVAPVRPAAGGALGVCVRGAARRWLMADMGRCDRAGWALGLAALVAAACVAGG